MFMRLAASGLLFCALAAPVVAGEKKPADPNKKICRSAPYTGSRFREQVCHTRAEWDVIAAQTERDLDDRSRRPEMRRPSTN